MDIRAKLGQMVCVGFDGTTPPEELLALIRTYKIGNLSLYAHNFTDKAQARRLARELTACIEEQTGIAPFLSVDQEGGMVTRFSGDFTHFPGAMAVTAAGEPENAYRVGLYTGRELLAVGLNADFAPVVDINSNGRNPVIGVRAYGDTPEQVIRYSMEMLRGLEDAGVLSMLKHFPGHGDTSADSHFALPTVDKTLDELFETELKPYIEGIRRGAPAIMTSHIVFPKIDPSGVPATMSRVILHDLLRERLGFKGIIRTDDLEMEAIRREFGILEGAVTAVRAGADIVSISRSPELAAQLIETLEGQIACGELPIEVVDAAVERILACKARYCGRPQPPLETVGCPEHRATARAISEQSVACYRDCGQLPVKGQVLAVGTNAFNQTNVRNPLQLELNAASRLAARLGGQGITVSTQPTPEEQAEVLALAAQADTVVLCTYNAHLFSQQLKLAQALAQNHRNVIFAALRNPYDLPLLPGNCTALACWEYTPDSLAVLGEVLAGALQPRGSICVSLEGGAAG